VSALELSYIPEPPHRSALERYGLLFYTPLRRAIGKQRRALQVLELACDDGFPSIEIYRELRPGSRLVIVGDESCTFERFYRQAGAAIPSALRRTFFARREEPARLPFAEGIFDLVYAFLAFRQPPDAKALITQALRCVRPGGQLIIVTPLRHSFLELTQAIAAVLQSHAGEDAVQHRLFSERPELLDLEAWKSLVRRAGGIELEATSTRQQLRVPAGVAKDALFASYLAPFFLGAAPQLLNAAPKLLGRAFSKDSSTTVHVGCLAARRGALKEVL
jgi:SAM-dependent methyltransferase